jgi:hypothetical protein
MHGSGKARLQDPFKETAITALRRVVDPLVDLMIDTGITVQEFSRLVRDRAVRSAAARVARESGRNSNSRVAIITGLARAEVARILETNEPSFGLRFEQLVATHSAGIPVRAMLDQLTQIGAVEILPGQRVRAKSRVPIFQGMTCSAIANIGERAGDLLSTLKHNLRTASTPLFEATAFVGDVDIGVVPLVRRQMAEQGTAFIEGATSLFTRSRSRSRQSSTKKTPQCRVGVTVYYFEDEIANTSGPQPSTDAGRRKNLQRQHIKLRHSDK